MENRRTSFYEIPKKIERVPRAISKLLNHKE